MENKGINYVGFAEGDRLPVDAAAALPSDRKFFIFPGFCDVHVHFREPGFSYKETIRSGSLAAARGGFTDVCAMPNLDPVPDSPVHLAEELCLIRRDAQIRVHPYASITVGQRGERLVPMKALLPLSVAFSDDGRGVQSREMMRKAMRRAKRCGRMIVAHCEDNSLLRGGYIHDGEYCRAHGHRGIVSESEWGPIARDLELVRETGCAYHVCHVSCKESVELIRQARREGLNVSCETAPHYLALSDAELQEEGRFKMNPPIRAEEDRLALIEGLRDGTIGMIATDHAPHSAEEKARGLEKSAFGVTGLECAFPVLYTKLVRTGLLTLEELIRLLTVNPRERFGLHYDPGFTVWELDTPYRLDPADFLSQGKSTPFEGMELYGSCYLTVMDGRAVYSKN